jgi:hypothetical protein
MTREPLVRPRTWRFDADFEVPADQAATLYAACEDARWVLVDIDGVALADRPKASFPAHVVGVQWQGVRLLVGVSVTMEVARAEECGAVRLAEALRQGFATAQVRTFDAP